MDAFAKEIELRINAFQQRLQNEDLGGVLITDRTNLYYYSGTGQQGYLYIPTKGRPCLFVKRSVDVARQESPLEEIAAIESIKTLPRELLNRDVALGGKALGMELDVLPANQYLFYQQLFMNNEIVDASTLIKKNRMIKSTMEIELLRGSAEQHAKVFQHIAQNIRLGMTDHELAGIIEGYARSLGHLGHMRFRGYNSEFYFGHVLMGPAGAAYGPYDVMPAVGKGLHPTFPQGVCGAVVEKGLPVYVDYVGNYTGYLVDQTRVFAVGKVSSKLEKAMDTALEIQDRIQDRLVEGENGAALYEESRMIAEKAGLQEHFMGYPKGVSFLGHGIGLEVNEWPIIGHRMDIELKRGMVIAIEPKFSFPNEGVVGVENTFVVGKKQCEKITQGKDTLTIV